RSQRFETIRSGPGVLEHDTTLRVLVQANAGARFPLFRRSEQFDTDRLRYSAHSLRRRGALSRRMAMSHVGQSRHHAEEIDEPRRRSSIPWKFSPPSKASEYHLIDLA